MRAFKSFARFRGVCARLILPLAVVITFLAVSATLRAQEGTPAGGTIPLPTSTQSATASFPVAITATATVEANATPASLPRPQVNASPSDPFVRVNEVMVLPLVVSKRNGEWFELFNMGSDAVNLRDWVIATATVSHTILYNLNLPAGGYVVLGPRVLPNLNPGVDVDYAYENVSLDLSGSLVLHDGAGNLVDAVRWDVSQLEAGKSLERVDYTVENSWRLAWRAWPGSLGDWGSPHAENLPPPTPTPKPVTPTRTPTPTRTQTPTRTPTLTRTPRPSPTPKTSATPRASATPRNTLTPVASTTPLPAAWLWLETPSPLWFEEVAYRGGGEEYVVLGNRSDVSVNLGGWMLADATYPGANEGVVVLPARILEAGDWVIVARNGADFQARWGLLPHMQLAASSAEIPQGSADRVLGKGSFALNDRGDTLLLLDPSQRIADAVTFGASGDEDDRIALLPRITAPPNSALHRLPNARAPLRADQRDEWLVDAPSPFAPLAEVGAPTAHDNPALSATYRAWWGSLNTTSNHTSAAQSLLPARWLLQMAAQQGLDFIAFADALPHYNLWDVPAAITLLPAWRWQGAGETSDEAAILYDSLPVDSADRWALLPWLVQSRSLVQWVSGEPPALPGVTMVQVRAGTLEQVRARALAKWRTRGAPLLPVVDGWLTGLAAQERAQNGLLEALAHARGWATTQAGLTAALSVDSTTGRKWLGDELDASNQVTVRIHAGHTSGAQVSVRLWQNDLILYEGTLADSSEIVRTIIAAPDAWLYVTVEGGGAQALSAPIHVRAEEGGALVLTEALADPQSDWNGDGVVDDSDEFIELYNAGSRPVSLAGWRLQDKREAQDGRGAYTFGDDKIVAAGAYFVLWRTESRTVLNSNDEALFLRTPGGGMASEVWWNETLPPDRSIARVGNGWLFDATPSPGRGAEAAVIHAQYTVAYVESSTMDASAPEMVAQDSATPTENVWSTGEVVTFRGAVAGIGRSQVLLADLIHPSSAPLLVRFDEGMAMPAIVPGEVWSVSGEVVREEDGSSWVRVTRYEDIVRIEVR